MAAIRHKLSARPSSGTPSASSYVYELNRSMIVGLNDNKHFDADRTIQTLVPRRNDVG
jgi:hypothetical protein